MRQMREWLFGRRIDHVLAAAAIAAEPLTVDEKFEIGVHDILTVLAGTAWGALFGPLLGPTA